MPIDTHKPGFEGTLPVCHHPVIIQTTICWERLLGPSFFYFAYHATSVSIEITSGSSLAWRSHRSAVQKITIKKGGHDGT
ncbi:hypothetical protein XENTR_v10016165 [Xenopus tropicalis]|nr:hypothetical protein XENTR_v10016165 [Xenopus tropicalis]